MKAESGIGKAALRAGLAAFCLAVLPQAVFAQTLPVAQDSYTVPSTGTNYGSAALINVGGAAFFLQD